MTAPSAPLKPSVRPRSWPLKKASNGLPRPEQELGPLMKKAGVGRRARLPDLVCRPPAFRPRILPTLAPSAPTSAALETFGPCFQAQASHVACVTSFRRWRESIVPPPRLAKILCRAISQNLPLLAPSARRPRRRRPRPNRVWEWKGPAKWSAPSQRGDPWPLYVGPMNPWRSWGSTREQKRAHLEIA